MTAVPLSWWVAEFLIGGVGMFLAWRFRPLRIKDADTGEDITNLPSTQAAIKADRARAGKKWWQRTY